MYVEKHPKIEKEVEKLQQERQKKLENSERQLECTVATITEQYESKRQQLDSDYEVHDHYTLILVGVDRISGGGIGEEAATRKAGR